MGLADELEQGFQILRGQRLEANGHDRQLRSIQVGDVLALNDMLLRGRVEDLHCRLRLGLQAAGDGLAVLGADGPEAVVGFDRTVGVENVSEDLAAVAGTDAGQVGPGCPSPWPAEGVS